MIVRIQKSASYSLESPRRKGGKEAKANEGHRRGRGRDENEREEKEEVEDKEAEVGGRRGEAGSGFG